MQLTLYGTGFCAPSPKTPGKPFRAYTGWGIDIGESTLQFDMGGGVLYKMLESGIDVMIKPTHLFISHLHIDHTLDLFQLMQGRCVETRNRELPKMFVAAPNNFREIIDKVWEAYRETYKLEDIFEIKTTSEGLVIEENDFKVSAFPIKHIEESYCYRLDSGGKTIVYSGDMGYDEKISEIGRDADVAILECSFPDKESLVGNHLCPEDIGKLAKLGNFKKIVLTHISPLCEGREDEMAATIKDIAGCEVIVGEDLLKIEV